MRVKPVNVRNLKALLPEISVADKHRKHIGIGHQRKAFLEGKFLDIIHIIIIKEPVRAYIHILHAVRLYVVGILGLHIVFKRMKYLFPVPINDFVKPAIPYLRASLLGQRNRAVPLGVPVSHEFLNGFGKTSQIGNILSYLVNLPVHQRELAVSVILVVRHLTLQGRMARVYLCNLLGHIMHQPITKRKQTEHETERTRRRLEYAPYQL